MLLVTRIKLHEIAMSPEMRTWVIRQRSVTSGEAQKKGGHEESRVKKRIIGERNVGLHAVPRELHGRGTTGTTGSILFITRSSYDDGALTYVAPGRL